MNTIIKTLGAKALIIATLGLATSVQAAPFNLAAGTELNTLAFAVDSDERLLHHVGGSRGGRGDGVFGGGFPYSFRHGQFNYGQLGVSRYQTIQEQRAIKGSRYYRAPNSSKSHSFRKRHKRSY